jgi:hypothetical protein
MLLKAMVVSEGDGTGGKRSQEPFLLDVFMVDGQVRARRGKMALMPRKAPGLRSSWRFRPTLKPTKSQNLA